MKHQDRNAIKIFAIASFLNDMGSDIIYPIWPLFVTTILKANMAALGFLDGLGESIVSVSQGISGSMSDRLRKRKAFIWLGYLFGALSRIGYALSTAWQHLIPFRILDRAGKIRSAPRDAIIADSSTKENRGRNFGLLRTADNLGAVCGILISVLLFSLLGYRKLFLLAAIPSAIGVILVLRFIQIIALIKLLIFPASFIAGILWDKINIFATFYFSLGFTLMSVIALIFVKVE